MRVLLTLFLLPTALLARGQAMGIQLGADYYHPVFKDNARFDAVAIYVGLHKDFDPRIGAEFDLKVAGWSEEGANLEFIYKAKYFCSRNDASSFYLGSFFGVQRLKGAYSERIGTSNSGYSLYETVPFSKTLIPIGVHLGVRGGLAGYFAEVNLMVGYSIGGGSAVGSGISAPETTALYSAIGFSWLGFGWDQ